MDVFKFIDASSCDVLCDTPLAVVDGGRMETSTSLTFDDIIEKDGPLPDTSSIE